MNHCEGHGGHHEMHGEPGCQCGFHRRYWTKAERLTMLEDYQKTLRAELEAVEEEIASLKRES